MADRSEWVHHIIEERWFYHDGVKDKRSAGMAVLEQWGVTQLVLGAVEQLYAQLRGRARDQGARPAARYPRNRCQEATERDSGSIRRQAA